MERERRNCTCQQKCSGGKLVSRSVWFGHVKYRNEVPTPTPFSQLVGASQTGEKRGHFTVVHHRELSTTKTSEDSDPRLRGEFLLIMFASLAYSRDANIPHNFLQMELSMDWQPESSEKNGQAGAYFAVLPTRQDSSITFQALLHQVTSLRQVSKEGPLTNTHLQLQKERCLAYF